MKKDFEIYAGIIIVVIALVVSVFFITASKHSNKDIKNVVGIANPASTNCIENGGELEMKEGSLGQYALCNFRDGSVCEEWNYFRGECKSGDVFVDLTNCESYFDGCNNCFVTKGKIGGCTEMACQTYEEPKCNRYSALVGEFCGGIAAFKCTEGLECVLDGNYPDAGGKCE